MDIKRRVKKSGVNVEIWPGGLSILFRWLFGCKNENDIQRYKHPAVDFYNSKSDSENNKEKKHGKS